MVRQRPKQTNTPDDWSWLADRDLTVAEYIAANMHPVPTEIVAYHCQQATEKFLKGALVILGEEPPYIHDLDELEARAEKKRPNFNKISIWCTTIMQFSSQSRYDKGIDLSEEDMTTTLHDAEAIKAFLQKEMPELFADKATK
jgi:HEPN domain-containing protein